MSATTTGPPIRNVGPTQLKSDSEYRPTMLETPARTKLSFDPDVALRFVYFCVVGTVCQQPLAEKPAGLSLNRHRIDQRPQGIAKPEKKRVP